MEVVRLFVVVVLLAALPAVADAQVALQPPGLQRRVAAIRLESLLRPHAAGEPTVSAPAATRPLASRRIGLEPGKGVLPDIRLTLAGPIGLRVVLGRGRAGPRSSIALIWQP